MEGGLSATKQAKPKKHSNGKSLATSSLDPDGKMSNGISKSKEDMPMSPGSSTGDIDGESSEMSVVGDNIQVVVRVRPLSQAEKDRGDSDAVQVPGEGGAVWIDNNLGQSKPFTFNKVFSEDSSQEKIFEECGIKHLIDMALEGYSCTVLAFGQTGSGKTYTLTGPVNLGSNWDENAEILPLVESFGLMQRSFRYLINQMSTNKSTFTLKASYLEVYNEKVQDLLELSSSRDSLVVRWSADRGFYVEDLFCLKCESEDDLMAVLEEGLRNRQVRAHCINDHSSRSHCMLTLHLDSETCDFEDDSGFVIVKYGRLCFVDLAGNERVKETKSSGELFTESQNINKSLLTLGNCISALSDAKKRNGYIPYRDSKLTKLLAKSIGGDGMTLMISCISPSSYFVSDTLNTLRYAQRAKKIKNKPVVQMDPKEKLILSLKREIKLLRKENVYFKTQLGLPTPASSRPSTTSISCEQSWTDNGEESLIETPTSTEDEESRTPTPWQALSANLSTRMPPGLYDMLQEYMVENENLRTENGDLYTSRDTMRRQNIVISRENEKLLKKLELLESRSSSAVSTSPRTPSGLGRVRSLTDDPKLFVMPTSQSTPLPSNGIKENEERASYSAGPSVATKADPSQQSKEATGSNVVSLPPVRKTRSNPSTTSEKVTTSTRPQQNQQTTLLNIQKDVEWLAKHQNLQRTNASQSKQLATSEGEKSTNESDDSSLNERANVSVASVQRSVKMSKIPQRVKEPSSYARIFAKHKASQPKKEDTDEKSKSENPPLGEPLRTSMNIAGAHGTFGATPGAPGTRMPAYGINHYQGQLPDPNDKLRHDLDVLANQIDYYRHTYSETNGMQKTRPR